MNALFERSLELAERHVNAGGLPPGARVDIYRHNLFESLGAALAAVHPTVHALVGAGFFRFLAHGYIRAHPSRSGNLHEFGGELAGFIAGFEPAASLPYLADCARLDWAWHVVFHTAPATPTDAADVLTQIAALPEDMRPHVRLRRQPAARLIASRWPVLRIWQVHQQPIDEGDAPLVDLDAGGDCVLVLQQQGEVRLHRLTEAEHALLDSLLEGGTLGDAVARALALDADADIGAAIARHLALGTLVGLLPPPAGGA